MRENWKVSIASRQMNEINYSVNGIYGKVVIKVNLDTITQELGVS